MCEDRRNHIKALMYNNIAEHVFSRNAEGTRVRREVHGTKDYLLLEIYIPVVYIVHKPSYLRFFMSLQT